MSLNRRAFLAGLSALGTAPWWSRLPLARADGPPLHLIVVTALGGWDVSYLFDPKLGLDTVDGPELDADPTDPDDEEVPRSFGDLTVLTNAARRPAATTFFERWADRAVVVNGIEVGNISHTECRVRMLTGTMSETRPDVAAIVGAHLGEDRPVPYMDVGGAGYTGPLAARSGRTGRSNQIRFLLDRDLTLKAPQGTGVSYPQYVSRGDDREAIAAWLDDRARRHVDRRGGWGRGAQRLDDGFEARDRALALRTDGQALAADLPGGRVVGLDTQVQLALDLLSSGLSHTLTLDSGGDWDSHTDAAEQHGLFDTLFTDLDALMTGLQDAALLDRTVVLCLSEMSRTPRRNGDGGKDHWPVTSALLLGGPLAGGRTVGATTDTLDAAPIGLDTGLPDPSGHILRHDRLLAGVLELMDVDPVPWLGPVEVFRGLA